MYAHISQMQGWGYIFISLCTLKYLNHFLNSLTLPIKTHFLRLQVERSLTPPPSTLQGRGARPPGRRATPMVMGPGPAATTSLSAERTTLAEAAARGAAGAEGLTVTRMTAERMRTGSTSPASARAPRTDSSGGRSSTRRRERKTMTMKRTSGKNSRSGRQWDHYRRPTCLRRPPLLDLGAPSC